MVTPSGETGAGNSNEPESMMTGTPSLRSRAIKPEESSPRRWKSTSATCGRRSVISFVASAVVAAGPVTWPPKAQGVVLGRPLHFGNPQPEESLTPEDHHLTLWPQVARNCWKKTSRLTPPAVAGQRTLSIACHQSVISSRRRARYLRS